MMKTALAIISATVVLAAADPAAQTPLTLDEALTIVRSENLEIKAAEYDLQSASEDESIAFGYRLGSLEFTQDAIRSDDAGNVFGFKLTSREADFGDFGFKDFLDWMSGGMVGDPLVLTPDDLNYPKSRSFFQSKLSYQVPLYTGGKLSAYGKISEMMTRMKGLDKAAVIDEKLYQTRKAYYDLALLKSSSKHFGTILDNVKTLEHMTATMIDEGYAKQTDLLEVQARRANVERMLNEIHANETLLYHFLSFLLNRSVTAIVTPSEDVPMSEHTGEQVLERNLDLKKAETGLEIRKEMLDASYAGYLPQVGAFGEIATADNTFLDDAEDHKAYTVGARLTWNLFNGGVTSAEVEKAKIAEMKMRTQVALARKGIALKLHQITTEIQRYDFEIASLNKELELASTIYESYAARYREQLSSMSDVIIKQSEQIEKILALLMAKNKRNERVFALQKLANGEAL